jgi:DNA/RNA endonuclease G (NUC1)
MITYDTYFYKIIYDLTPPQKMIGFLLPNKNSDKPLRVFAVTVDEIERLTGLDFSPKYRSRNRMKWKKLVLRQRGMDCNCF